MISDFLVDGRWRCTQCGDCCRFVGLLPDLGLDRGDGTCRNLTADNRCAIYATRPEVCRTKEGNDMDKAAACNLIRRTVEARHHA